MSSLVVGTGKEPSPPPDVRGGASAVLPPSAEQPPETFLSKVSKLTSDPPALTATEEEKEYEIDPMFDWECIMIVANALRTPIRPYYGEKTTTGGQGKRRREEDPTGEPSDEDPTGEPSEEDIRNATNMLNEAARAQGSTAEPVRVSKRRRTVMVPRRRRLFPPPRRSTRDEEGAQQVLTEAARGRAPEQRPVIVRPDVDAGRSYALLAAGGALGPDVRKLLLNAMKTVLTAPGALTEFYKRYRKYINAGVSFIGLTDIQRTNSIIVAVVTALIQTIAEFIPTPTEALAGLLNTNANIVLILQQAFPIMLTGLIAYGCSTVGELTVHGILKELQRTVTQPGSVVRDIVGKVADIRDSIKKLLEQGPKMFFGNIAVGAFNRLMDSLDPEKRFHRFEQIPPIQSLLPGMPPRIVAPSDEAAAAAPRLNPVELYPEIENATADEVIARLQEILTEPPAEATTTDPSITEGDREAIEALLAMANGVVVLDQETGSEPASTGGRMKRRKATKKNKRRTPRRRAMSKRNLRRR